MCSTCRRSDSIGRDILTRCGNSGGGAVDSEIVNRCKWHFNNSENGALCSGKARSKDFVEQCVWNFGANERGLSCITGD